MKKTSILLAAVFAVSTLLVSWVASSNNGAVVLNDFGCGLFDGNHNLVWADQSHAVITPSGNGNYTCSVKDVANPTGSAVIWADVPYSTPNGPGVGRIVVSASGNASVSVKVRP